MNLKPLPGFEHFQTHHCVTGSMRHIYVYNDHPLSEEMLLGLGAGVSFSYWHFKGQLPFMGGRGGFKPPLEEAIGERTGVLVERHVTMSERKARNTLLELLECGQPVMIGCDMGFLPYFDFGGEEYHFGGHAVVVCGYDPEIDHVLVADREEELHPVPMDDLAHARGSKFKPFPPKNLWFTFDFSNKRRPSAIEVQQAIRDMTGPMLEPPIRNIGVKGMRKAASLVPMWSEKLNPDALKFALFNAYIFISPVGGTGGGNFRFMFSRFLAEAGGITGDARLAECSEEFERIGDRWEELGEWFRHLSEAPEPASLLPESAAFLNHLADAEELAWRRLATMVNASP